jgi:hypothetical protein
MTIGRKEREEKKEKTEGEIFFGHLSFPPYPFSIFFLPSIIDERLFFQRKIFFLKKILCGVRQRQSMRGSVKAHRGNG